MAKLYGSVNGQAKEITKLYGAVRAMVSTTGEVRTGSESVITGFNETTFRSAAWKKTIGNKTASYLAFRVHCNGAYIPKYSGSLYIYFPDDSYTDVAGSGGTTRLTGAELAAWVLDYGLTIDSSALSTQDTWISYYVDLTPTYGFVAKEILKLYGSVNGQTKSIYDTSA